MNAEHHAITDRILATCEAADMPVLVMVEMAFKAGLQYRSPSGHGKMGLTAKQHKLLTFIVAYTKRHGGVCPSYEEMTKAIGVKSKSGIHRLVIALEERGHIIRMPDRARAIEVITGKTAA
jgi:hypothetical protein